MKRMRSILWMAVIGATTAALGCQEPPPPYGTERALLLPTERRQIWAVAPAINLSGQKGVDPLLQADLLYEQLQQVRGITAIPVNRVVEVYQSLRIDRVQSEEQALLVCDLLGCDGLLVPTITAYDPYDPPKLAASLQLFRKPGGYQRPSGVDPRQLARAASPGRNESVPAAPFVQAVGMFDAANGTVREAVYRYAHGRHDPTGPLGAGEYLASMDRFVGFVYHTLIEDLIASPQLTRS